MEATMRLPLTLTMLTTMAGLAVTPALAQDEALGRTLVSTYCGGCHAIERVGSSPYSGAPPFRDLHLRYDVETLSEALVEGLVSGHPDMPEFAFEPHEAAAIIAYLQWLSK
jgi:cytochrome c